MNDPESPGPGRRAPEGQPGERDDRRVRRALALDSRRLDLVALVVGVALIVAGLVIDFSVARLLIDAGIVALGALVGLYEMRPSRRAAHLDQIDGAFEKGSTSRALLIARNLAVYVCVAAALVAIWMLVLNDSLADALSVAGALLAVNGARGAVLLGYASRRPLAGSPAQATPTR